MGEVGIAIVTHNSEPEIGPCLDRAVASGAQVVVVDNASEDGTRQQILRRGVRLIANQSNRGFAAATNQAIQALQTPYVLLLNPDTVLQTSLQPLREACEAPAVAGAGGMLVGHDGKAQAGFMVRRLPSAAALVLEALLINRLWPGNPVNWHYRCLDLDVCRQQSVEQPAGAFLMVRREVWEELGGLDESFYPVWFEDVDFCKRAADRGYRFVYVPASVAVHTGGHSIGKILLEKRQLYWYGSVLRYAARHFPPARAKTIGCAVLLGSCIRMVMGIVLGRSLKPVAVYGGVARLASRFILSGCSR